MASARWSRWKDAAGLLGKGVGIAALGTGVLCLGVGAYGARQINSRRQRWFSDAFVLTPETLRLPYKNIEFETADGVRLNGWLIEQTIRGQLSPKVALCCNPYNQDKSSLLGVARGLWDNGFSVLLYDFRSHGPESVPQSVGYYELRDATAALDWLCANKPPEARIGLVGASMGGAMALCLAAQQRPEVIACATDCAFSSLKEVVGVRLDKMFPTTRLFGLDSVLPLHLLFLESICLVNRLWYGYDPAKVGPRSHLDRIEIPLLIVHSEQDSVVPVNQGYDIYTKARSSNKQFYIVKDTEHIGSYYKDEKEYTRRIVRFLDECFSHDSNAVFVSGHEIPIKNKHPIVSVPAELASAARVATGSEEPGAGPADPTGPDPSQSAQAA